MAAQPTNAWRTTLKRRLAVAGAALLLWSAAIEARLVYLQVVRHADLTARAERQQLRTVEAPAKRGELTDRNGKLLAYSVDADSVYVVPTEIDDPDRAAAGLCAALGDCDRKDRQALADRIRRGRAFAYVRRQVSPEQARRVAALGMAGVGFMKESRRFYPNRTLAGPLLGYVGIDNAGLHGIEATYDSLIKGRPGTVLIQTDARRHPFSHVERPPTTGATLELTIDEYLQHVTERELQAGVEWAGAEGGAAIMMDPATGEILALASYPTFNPNAYRDVPPERRRNRAIQDLYEPGSTFKVVTAGAALEEHVIKPSDMVDVSGGLIRIGSRVVNDTHNYGVLSFEDVIVKSSNVGAIKVGFRLGPQRLGAYVRRFGFGRAASPDFPGESRGIVWRPDRLSDGALASVSMGYQIGVTPLQMVTAVSSVANGGELLEPRVVRAVTRNGRRVPVPRKVVGRTVSADTARQLTTMMEAVVDRGTATLAKIDGYTIAGKTGTASKVIDGRYSRSHYNVSFVGFVPSRQPRFAIIVVIDSPHKVSPYGGTVAAPIFKRIAESALRHQGVPRSINPPSPVLVAAAEDESRTQPVIAAAARPGLILRDGQSFPDLRGMSAREALRTLAQLGVHGRVNGAGLVVSQRPQPGAPIDRGGESEIWLARNAPAREPEARP